MPGREGLIRAFGVREVVAGLGLRAAPAHSAGMRGRAASDALDIAALGTAARTWSGNKAIWGALAFVAGATALDILVARGLDRTTGKTWFGRARPEEAAPAAA